MSRPTLDDIQIIRHQRHSSFAAREFDRHFNDYKDAKNLKVTVVDGGLVTEIKFVPNIRFGRMYWHSESREVSNIHEDDKTMEITLKNEWHMLKDDL